MKQWPLAALPREKVLEKVMADEAEFLAPTHLTKDQLTARVQLGRILFRFTDVADLQLSDRQKVLACLRRYLKARRQPLIDPNE